MTDQPLSMAKQMNSKYDASIFVDDGGIDAWEFESNYIRFDSRDPVDTQRAWSEANKLWATRQLRDGGRPPALSIRPPTLQGQRLSA